MGWIDQDRNIQIINDFFLDLQNVTAIRSAVSSVITPTASVSVCLGWKEINVTAAW